VVELSLARAKVLSERRLITLVTFILNLLIDELSKADLDYIK
jgi:hypothetical protein